MRGHRPKIVQPFFQCLADVLDLDLTNDGSRPGRILAEGNVEIRHDLHPFPALPAAYHLDSARTPFIPPGPILSHDRPSRPRAALRDKEWGSAGPAAGTRRGRPFELRRAELSGRRAERFDCACSALANYDQFSAAASS